MTHVQFLTSGGIFEGVLLVIAFIGGWLTGVNPTLWLSWSPQDLLMGLLATVPMLIMLAISLLVPSKGMQQIRRFLRQSVGHYLVQCRPLDIFLLSVLAGVCEEILFRGFFFQWISHWNFMMAVLITNLLFALAHSITPMYALLAAFLGLYLTALVGIDKSPNLLIPIIAHTLYDFVAFYVVIFDTRRNAHLDEDEDDHEQSDEHSTDESQEDAEQPRSPAQ